MVVVAVVVHQVLSLMKLEAMASTVISPALPVTLRRARIVAAVIARRVRIQLEVFAHPRMLASTILAQLVTMAALYQASRLLRRFLRRRLLRRGRVS